ncbi:MAG: ABC transporter ATP-binding protein [Acholeplasmataceae bacterium]
MNEKKPLLEVRNLKKYFDVKKKLFGGVARRLHAVDDVSFAIYPGETFGLVGESGCGKTTTGRTVIGLYESTGGEIYFDGKLISVGTEGFVVEIKRLKDEERQELKKAKSFPERKKIQATYKKLIQEQSVLLRDANQKNDRAKRNRRDIQMIFQDPYASLNPRMTVLEIVAEGIRTHGLLEGKAVAQRVYYLLETVGLKREHASRYPHEFSGGQRQRIGIARALAVDPKLIICDEPISALDVSIQAQVVNMLEDLQDQFGLTYLFIAHDLSMVKYISDRIGVMYLGKLMEVAPSEGLYEKPLHPYTKSLLSSIPLPDPEANRKAKRMTLKGEVTSPINPEPGCQFASRCPYAEDHCRKVDPVLEEVLPGRFVACHFVREINDLE